MKLQKFEKKLRIFQVFKFSIRAEIKNLETLEFSLFPKLNKFFKICKFQFSLSEKTTLEFLCFQFDYKNKNGKLGNVGNFQLPKVKSYKFCSESYKFWNIFQVFQFFDFKLMDKKLLWNFKVLKKIMSFLSFSISVQQSK